MCVLCAFAANVCLRKAIRAAPEHKPFSIVERNIRIRTDCNFNTFFHPERIFPFARTQQNKPTNYRHSVHSRYLSPSDRQWNVVVCTNATTPPVANTNSRLHTDDAAAAAVVSICGRPQRPHRIVHRPTIVRPIRTRANGNRCFVGERIHFQCDRTDGGQFAVRIQ